MPSETYVPKKYVELENPYGHKRRKHHHHRGCGCGCLKWLCCCCFSCCRCCICTLLIIIILLMAITVGLYYYLKPNIPSYDVENIDVKTLEMRDENKVYSEIVVIVKADNPTEDISLDYLENEVAVMYSGTQLCSGQIPPFLQPGKNTTMINIDLKGEGQLSDELQAKFMKDQKEERIPFLITVKLPIRIVVTDFFHLRKFLLNVNCLVILDKVESNKRPNILDKHFAYDIKL